MGQPNASWLSFELASAFICSLLTAFLVWRLKQKKKRDNAMVSVKEEIHSGYGERMILIFAKYGLTEKGFLPIKCRERLPKYYERWESLVDRLPELNRSGKLRKEVTKLSALSCDQLEEEDMLRRAYIVLGMLLHSYVNGDKVPWDSRKPDGKVGCDERSPMESGGNGGIKATVELNEKEVTRRDDSCNSEATVRTCHDNIPSVPPQLAVPWYEVCRKLDMPFILTAALDIWNYKLVDDSKPHDLSNLTLISTMTGTRAEVYFHMVPCMMQYAAAQVIPQILLLYDDIASDMRMNAECKETASHHETLCKGMLDLQQSASLDMVGSQERCSRRDGMSKVFPNGGSILIQRQDRRPLNDDITERDSEENSDELEGRNSAQTSEEKNRESTVSKKELDVQMQNDEKIICLLIDLKNVFKEFRFIATKIKEYVDIDTFYDIYRPLLSGFWPDGVILHLAERDEKMAKPIAEEEGRCCGTVAGRFDVSGSSTDVGGKMDLVTRAFESIDCKSGGDIQDGDVIGANATNDFGASGSQVNQCQGNEKIKDASSKVKRVTACDIVIKSRLPNGDIVINPKGPSAGQSTMMVLFDLILGIMHKGAGKEFQEEMANYMPLPHRQVVYDVRDIVERHGSLRDFILKSRNSTKFKSLVSAYNECIEAGADFRSLHLGIAVKYLVRTQKGTGSSSFRVMLSEMMNATKKMKIV